MTPTWYEILKGARRLAGKDPGGFDAAALAAEARIQPTSRSTAARLASAWLSKFVRWGYVRISGNQESRGGRPMRLYQLTRWGHEFRPGKTRPG